MLRGVLRGIAGTSFCPHQQIRHISRKLGAGLSRTPPPVDDEDEPVEESPAAKRESPATDTEVSLNAFFFLVFNFSTLKICTSGDIQPGLCRHRTVGHKAPRDHAARDHLVQIRPNKVNSTKMLFWSVYGVGSSLSPPVSPAGSMEPPAPARAPTHRSF